VESKQKILRLAGVTALAVWAGFGSGCGGIGASGSVSPATFLLPGIGQNAPQANPQDGGAAASAAQAAAAEPASDREAAAVSLR